MKKLLLTMLAFFAMSSIAMAAVNLNSATKQELEAVNGIGPVKAQAIIDYRKKNGAFKSVTDLKNVPGFGDKSVTKVDSELSVGSAVAAQGDKKMDKKAAMPAANAKPASNDKPAKAVTKMEDKAVKK